MQITQKNFYKKFLGKIGEKLAKKYLIKKGYKILETNFKTHTGEIDIIAKDGQTFVFIEVKTRSSDEFGAPIEAVDENRVRRYYRTATEYIVKNRLEDPDCRFDVIEIENDEINHVINAFSM